MDPLIGAALITGGAGILQSGLNFASGNYSLNKQIQASKNMAKWQATKLPAYQRQGFENAGYNPLLMFGAQPVHPESFSMNGQNFDFASGFGQVAEAMTAKEQADNTKKYQEALVDNQKAEVANKQAQTKVLEAQAEETRLNNKENRELQSTRDKMSFVGDLLGKKLDFLKSSAGHTGSTFQVGAKWLPIYFSRSEDRDNYMSENALASIDAAIKKYGDGLFDHIDKDEAFDTIIGTVSNIERTRKRVTHDLQWYWNALRDRVNSYLTMNSDKFWRGYYNGKRKIEEYKQTHPDRIIQHKKNLRKHDRDESIRIYRDYNTIPGLEPWRR